MTRIAREQRFQARRSCLSAQPTVQHRRRNRNANAQEHDTDQNHKLAASHEIKKMSAVATGRLSKRSCANQRSPPEAGSKISAPRLCPPLRRSKTHSDPDAPAEPPGFLLQSTSSKNLQLRRK